MTGYIRNDTANNIAANKIASAADLDGEFDAIVDAFDESTGHTHDGSSAEGAPITVTGPAQEYVSGAADFSPKTDNTYDLGTASLSWRNAHIEGQITAGSLTLTSDLPIAEGGTGASTAADARTNLGVVIGTDVQSYDAGLDSIAGLSTSANQLIYTTGADTYAVSALTSFGRTLLDDTNATEARTTLGLGSISTQGSSSVTITGGTISGITDLAVADGGTGASTAGNARTNLGLVIGADVQAYNSVLDTYVSNSLTAGELTQLQNINTSTVSALQWGYVGSISAWGATLIDDADAAAGRATLGLGDVSVLDTVNNNNWSGADLAVANGGTGASNASDARNNLGLGTMALQNATSVNIDGGTLSNVTIDSGTITGITDLAIANGGTGASSAAGARGNLGLGSIATQASTNVNIDGGFIDGTTIGGTTPLLGTFTDLISDTLEVTPTDSTIPISATAAGQPVAAIMDSNTPASFVYFTNGAATNDSQVAVGSINDDMRIIAGGTAVIDVTDAQTEFSNNIYVGQNTALFPGAGNTTVGASYRTIGSLHASTASDASTFNRNSNGQTVRFFRSGTGVGDISVTATATTYNTTSDYRLKENVVEIDDALERVSKLKPSRFNFKAAPKETVDGFLAHEAAEAVPEAVQGEKDGDHYQTIDHSKLVPLLTAGLQKAIKKIEELEYRIEELEDDV